MKILLRILGFPFVAILGLIGAGRHYLNFLYCFARYGGEMVVYDKRSRQTIAHILEIVEAKHEQDRIATEAWKKALREMKPTATEDNESTNITVTYYP